MIDRGMIIETDHFSVKARGQALDILERRGYPGVITSHSWGDDTSQRRLQALGGVVAPYGHETRPLRRRSGPTARAGRKPGALFGVGYGSDTNGLGAQPQPRADAFRTRSTYPYRTFDGGTVMSKQRSGTRVYDINIDGVPHYGLLPRLRRGPAQARRRPDRHRHGQRGRGLPADVGAGPRRPNRLNPPNFPCQEVRERVRVRLSSRALSPPAGPTTTQLRTTWQTTRTWSKRK